MKMPKALCWAALLTASALGPQPAWAALEWRLSVKIILDASGNRPVGTNAMPSDFAYNWDTTDKVQQAVNDYNELLGRMGWGYRFRLEVLELGGISEWFSRDARDPVNRTLLETEAKLNPARYAYRWDAINVYINNTASGISGGHLPLIGDVIMMGATAFWSTLLHEAGHALGLCHTQGCFCGNCSGDPTGSCNTPGDDNIADTILDLACWSRDQVAQGNFGLLYSSLNAAQKRQVDDVWQNVMSYHVGAGNPRTGFTHDQWERMVDVSNLDKRNVTSGQTVFVDRNNPCVRPEDLPEPFRTLAAFTPGWSWGTRNGLGVTLDPRSPPPGLPPAPCPPSPLPCSMTLCLGGPFKNIADAVNAANGGDRLQIKAGAYNETMRITKALTLATDRGWVTIGRP